jgi:Phage integrase, N-terminal SAM-like domain
MSSRGNIYRRCVKGHSLAQGKCSGRCLRWYPRIELPRGPDGKRRLISLGGYPTRKQAEAAVTEELQRRRGLTPEPHKLTVNQYLDRWLAHIQTTRRARTVARYRTLLAHHVRPYIGAQRLTALEPLQVQGIYDQLGVGGRKDGRPGGLDPSTSWPCTAACTARWSRPSPGGSAPTWTLTRVRCGSVKS